MALQSDDFYTKSSCLISEKEVREWRVSDVLDWARHTQNNFSETMLKCIQKEGIDGEVLLALTEDDIRDFRYRLRYALSFGEMKKLWISVRALQKRHREETLCCNSGGGCYVPSSNVMPALLQTTANGSRMQGFVLSTRDFVSDNTPMCCPLNGPCSGPATAKDLPPEYIKAVISLGYCFLVTWITSFVMVIVHERVPDMKRYPPLPDIFLDNVPHIAWAFDMCEITGTILFTIWICVCVFHKYRSILLRRFFALAGTVFLLRCITMLITSLSVPGTHLQCNQNDFLVDDTKLSFEEALFVRIQRAYTIWSGLGMSIQGVRTCGDYMFSGHTVALTLLNFFITEYTPRHLYFLHTLTWLLNMFGIFFILAAHEHYSIDVFVAFYITSRLFLYYHTLANNQALMQRDSTRTRIWFPMFSYFESSVVGIVPNEFDTISALIERLVSIIMNIKDSIMLTTRRFWLDPPIPLPTRNIIFFPGNTQPQMLNAATSMSANIANSSSAQSSTASFKTAYFVEQASTYINKASESSLNGAVLKRDPVSAISAQLALTKDESKKSI